ncbi:MAG: PEP/pyruvate-binding domain-containing protein [Pirellulaceae bacterium]
MSSCYVSPDSASAVGVTRRNIGGKAYSLHRLRELSQPVPAYYVVTMEAFRTTLAAQQPVARWEGLLHRLQCAAEESARAAVELRAMIRQLEWPREVLTNIETAHRERFGSDASVAVRSSAFEEDSSSRSFAGMYDSVLNVRGLAGVLEAIKQVWSSSFTERVLAYRRRHGLPFHRIDLAVLVQQMIVARQSGVMFTCNPITGDTGIIRIDAVLGNGSALVQGDVDADAYRVRKSDSRILCETPVGMVCDAGSEHHAGNSNGGQPAPVLTESQVRRLAETGIAVERLFASPQDIEFCFDEQGELFLLQARPVTSSRTANPVVIGHQVWDNSNIVESYSGVTTPLTFSFIRRAYSIVYRCFAEVMGIRPHVVHEQRAMFANMLGLFQGRVYYNLKSWYRLVRLFPGYRYNSSFMESMMGVKEPLLLEEETPRPGIVRRWFVELPALLVLATRILWKFVRIRSIVGQFQHHFDQHYAQWHQIDLRSLQSHQLLALYRQMEDALLWNWRAPIINDFFVMVFYGILKKLCVQWCGDESGSLQNGLLCGTGGLESARPAKLLLQLARVASQNEELRELIMREPLRSLPQLVTEDPRFDSFRGLLNRYLDDYGLRCADELKLETISHRDCPERIFQIIRDYLKLNDPHILDEQYQAGRERERLEVAERTAFAAISRSRGWFPRKWLFRRVLSSARLGIRNRENLRFSRTKIYGIARAMFRTMGEHFVRDGVLDNVEDVFYLTTDEVWDYVQGTAVSADLRGLAAGRRKEYDAYRASDAPPDDRFETFGMVYNGNRYRKFREDRTEMTSSLLRGLSCCPGIVEGTVQVVLDPSQVDGFSGDILVAKRTDPGWVLLFPAFRAMLVERGSVLSHSAIVAREMGIPTVVGVTGLTDRLTSGQRVRVDGLRGTVEILNATAVQDRTSST